MPAQKPYLKYPDTPIDPPARYHWYWSREDIEQLVFLRRAGLNGAVLAKELGRTNHSVVQGGYTLLHKVLDEYDDRWDQHRCEEAGCQAVWADITREAATHV